MIKKLLFTASIFMAAMTAKSQLVITEIMYNPPESGTDSLEFVEVYNNTANPIDLTNYQLFFGTTGANMPAVTLNGGEYIALTNDSTGFAHGYGFSARAVALSGLSNSSRDVKIKDMLGVLVDSVFYDDGAPWPTQADGFGYSLELCDVNSDNTDANNWKISETMVSGLVVNSYQVYATPGAANTVACGATVTPELNLYPIATVHTEDANGVADSIGVACKLKGIVTSVDFDGNGGYSFYIYDGTGAINIWNFNDEPGGYQSTMGDSIIAYGTITQYNGLTELAVDSIDLLNQGNTLPMAMSATMMDESNEAHLITLSSVVFVDTVSFSSGMNAMIKTMTNDTLEVFLDADVAFTFVPDFTRTYDITGLVTQSDFSSPYDSLYKLLPRMDADIVMLATTNINETSIEKVQVYPNPVVRGNELRLSANVTASVLDVTGRQVDFIQNENVVSTSRLERGTYILVGREINVKFIVK